MRTTLAKHRSIQEATAWRLAKAVFLLAVMSLTGAAAPGPGNSPAQGAASWYGEEHRGKLMANGKRFDPDKFTAASWFYPLGTKVRVTVESPSRAHRSVVVTITDRGPARELVRSGRIIDLGHAPFKQLARPQLGLVAVTVQPIE